MPVSKKRSRTTRRSPKKSSKRSTRRSPKKSSKRSTRRSPKKSSKRSTRRSPKKSSKRSTRRSPKKSSKRSTRRSPKKSSKRSTKKASKKRSKRSPKKRSNSTRRKSLAYSRQRQGKTSTRVNPQTKRVKNSDVTRPSARSAYDEGVPLGTRRLIPQPGGRIAYLKELRLRANGTPYWAMLSYEEGGRSRPV
jgi:hypothetical protein